MKVRCVDHFSPAFIHPDLFMDGLAVGAVTVSAGIIVGFGITAVRAPGDVEAEFSGLAVHNGVGSLPLCIGLEVSG